MPITLTCPSCGKQCAVKEEYAGQQVKCPSCPAVITVPHANPHAEAIIAPELATTAPVASSAPPVPNVAVANFLDKVTKFLAANGVAGVNRILLFVGLSCLAIFLITIRMPWTP